MSPSREDAILRIAELPEGQTGEYVSGRLEVSPRPRAVHLQAEGELFARVRSHFGQSRGAGGWVILAEPELHLGPDICVPDIAAWRREEMPELPEVVAFEQPPTWICEVLSPSTAQFDRAFKLPAYARHGVRFAWIVDAAAQTVEVYALDGATWRLLTTVAADATVRLPPFEELELPLAALWAR